MKGQLVTDFATGQFIAVASGKGRIHDLQLWRISEVRLVESCLCLADKGYQGIAQQHEMSITLQRKPPRKSLPQADKQANRAFARLRIRVEHSIRRLKRFRIFAERYRNRRRRFGLRSHLLAGILNYEMGLAS